MRQYHEIFHLCFFAKQLPLASLEFLKADFNFLNFLGVILTSTPQ